MTIRVGVLGLGVMGRRMVQRMEDDGRFTIVAGWDPSPDALAALHDLSPSVALAASATDLCARAEIDLVYIASPPASHVPLAHAALDHGKAVFCEKPLSVDIVGAVGLVQRLSAQGGRIAVNYVLATSPAVTAIAESLAEEGAGSVTGAALSVGFRDWPRPWQRDAASWLAKRAEGGFTREVISHFLFVLRRLLGPLLVMESEVVWSDQGDGAERELTVSLTAGGRPVQITGHVGRITADDRNELVITTASGAFRLYDWRQLEQHDRGGWASVRLTKEANGPGSAQLDAVIDWLEGRPHRLATLEEALQVQLCVEEILSNPD